MRHLVKVLFIAAIIISFRPASFLAYAASDGQKKIVTLGNIANMLSKGVNRKDADVAIQMLAEQLIKELKDYQIKNIIYPDLQSAVKDINEGQLDILTLSTLAYFKIKDNTPITPEYITSPWDRPENEFLLLVHRDSNINSLKKKKNKRIVIKKDYSYQMVLMWLNTLLIERSLPDAATFFKTIKHTDKDSKTILPVFFKQADACIVHRQTFNTMKELNPQVGKRLMALFESPGFVMSITCHHNNMDKKIKDLINIHTESADKTPMGKQILTIFKMKNLFKYKPEYLNNVEKLITRYKSLKTAADERKVKNPTP